MVKSTNREKLIRFTIFGVLYSHSSNNSVNNSTMLYHCSASNIFVFPCGCHFIFLWFLSGEEVIEYQTGQNSAPR